MVYVWLIIYTPNQKDHLPQSADHRFMQYQWDYLENKSQKRSITSKNSIQPAYLLTYLAIITCYRSWPQLICGAIHHDLLQLGANFGYPAFLDTLTRDWPTAGEAVLVCDIHLRFEDFRKWVGAIHTSNKTLYSKTLPLSQ